MEGRGREERERERERTLKTSLKMIYFSDKKFVANHLGTHMMQFTIKISWVFFRGHKVHPQDQQKPFTFYVFDHIVYQHPLFLNGAWFVGVAKIRDSR